MIMATQQINTTNPASENITISVTKYPSDSLLNGLSFIVYSLTLLDEQYPV